MDAPEPSRRWWLSHDCQVLFAIAIAAAFGLSRLVWQDAIVRHRLNMRWQIHDGGGALFARNRVEIGPHTEGDCNEFDALGPGALVQIHCPEPDSSVSRWRLLLGDEEIDEIWFWRPLTAADREAIAAFPEADIQGPAEPTPGKLP